MEDRPGRQQMLGSREDLLDGPKLLVTQHGSKWVEIGVGVQHEDAVEPLDVLDRIDREVVLAGRLEVATIAGIPDQRFVTAGRAGAAARSRWSRDRLGCSCAS
jgi:hypothetical protein